MLRCLTIPDNELKAFMLRQPSVMYRMLQVRSAAAAGRERLAELTEKPFPPGDYDVVVVGSGPGGLQTAYSLARAGVERCAVISRDDGPGGMFRKFPVYQRLISWTKPDAPFERGTREYEWYDHNSLLGDEPSHRALAPEFMDRAFDLPARHEMESALVEFARRGGVRVRYECEWLSTTQQDGQFTLTTTDGDYRCRACVFALGTTDPWKPAIPGIEDAPHYADTQVPARYEGKSVFIVGKRNSGFEVAQGLLPWARKIVLASPAAGRHDGARVLAAAPSVSAAVRRVRSRRFRGATSSTRRIERIERHADGYRIHVSGTSWDGKLVLESDDIVAATGFRVPLRDLPDLGVATIGDGRLPAQTPYWESVSVPGIYFAGNATSASAGMRKHGATANSTSVNGFRYNARVLALHVAEKHFGLARSGAVCRATRSSRSCWTSSRARPSSGSRRAISRGWSRSTRSTAFATRGSCRSPSSSTAATATHARSRSSTTNAGRIVPVVYVRRAGKLAEYVLPPNPLHEFDTDEHRTELAARLAPLLGSVAAAAHSPAQGVERRRSNFVGRAPKSAPSGRASRRSAACCSRAAIDSGVSA